ncbi:MAG: hypothetical protein A3H71_01920 [Candidatus Sungbacteria bacterium RIFCSPLOWO2_02_FULL_48_13b]|uniref:Uncharacterized protein n=2 Tax=Candidatus Sungiibacteriota TaxID=1817917 RepID=A0A1G2LHL6_9BACT|nr:MAG: hypothetical protein A3C12_01380 [Candidatus Sungbacteria bacterium RIFCSPHIGHO2_02_FULL_49_20]OHA10322.1 MAG: hypothetical protein A3H71_01920 [Candidatus Sungbacteria bacterium RIFCSPLOWO2_02_FULL_48_13b]
MINTNWRSIFQVLRERPIAVIGILMILLLAGAFLLRDKLQSLLGVSSPPQIGVGTGQPLPKYVGRDIREIRMTPEEVKLFTEAQKASIQKSILDAAGSIDANPDLLAPWLQLGLYKKVIGDFEGARDAWEYASQIRPQNVVSFNNLGELYGSRYYLPDFLKSELNFQQAIKNDPTYIQAYISLSELYRYSYTEKSSLAEKTLFDGLKSNPDHTDLISYIARFYAETGKIDQAIEYYQKLKALRPSDALSIDQDIAKLRR